MKALEKDRSQRYQSASDLSRDVHRNLRNEPVEARPPTSIYRARKFIRRHRAGALTSSAFLVIIIGGIGTYLHGVGTERRKTEAALLEAQHQRDDARLASARAVDAEAKANVDLVLAAVTAGHGARVSSRSGRRFDTLKLLADAARISPTAAVRSQAIACIGLADMRVRQQWTGEDEAVCFNHACTLYADCTSAGEVRVYRVPTFANVPPQLVVRIPGRVWRRRTIRETSARVAFSRDDLLIAVSHDDGNVRIYQLDGRLVREIASGPGCDFTPDGTSIVTCYPLGSVRIVGIASGKVQKEFHWPGTDSVSVSPDGNKVALWTSGRSNDITIGEIDSGVVAPLSMPARVSMVAWHPNSNVIATAADDHGIYISDVSDVAHGRVVQVWGSHAGGVISVDFSHDGRLLASSSLDGTVRLWDTLSNEQLVRVFCTGIVRFRPDDQLLAVASYNGQHHLLDVASGSIRRTFTAPAGDRTGVAFSPDGSIMACDGGNRSASGTLLRQARHALKSICPSLGTADPSHFTPMENRSTSAPMQGCGLCPSSRAFFLQRLRDSRQLDW